MPQEEDELRVEDVTKAICTAARILAVARGESPETMLKLFPGRKFRLVEIAWSYLKRGRRKYSHVLKR